RPAPRGRRIGTEDARDFEVHAAAADGDVRAGHAEIAELGVASLEVDREARGAHALRTKAVLSAGSERERLPGEPPPDPAMTVRAVVGLVVDRAQGDHPREVGPALPLHHPEHSTEIELIGRDAHA